MSSTFDPAPFRFHIGLVNTFERLAVSCRYVLKEAVPGSKLKGSDTEADLVKDRHTGHSYNAAAILIETKVCV